MRLSRSTIYIFFVIFSISCASSNKVSVQPQPSTAIKSQVLELMHEVPAPSQSEFQELYRQLIALGPSAIPVITDRLKAPGQGKDAQARYLLNGLTKYVARPNAESERAMVEEVLLAALNKDYPETVDVFLMEQLELIGSNEAIPVLQSFIGVDRLNESAVHALRAINTKQSRKVLVEALGQTSGAKRIAVIKALDDLQVTHAANALLPFAKAEDWPTRQAALYALAQTGNPVAIDPLKTALDAYDNYKKTQVISYVVLLAQRLAEEGHQHQSTEIANYLLTDYVGSQIKSSALTILAQNTGTEATDELLTALESKDKRLRTKALTIFQHSPELKIPQPWMDKLHSQSPATQTDVLYALAGTRQGTFELASSYLNSPNLPVRLAAIRAIALSEAPQAIDRLFKKLEQTQKKEEISALEAALLQLPTEPLVAKVVEAIPSTSGSAKTALIEILVERGATNQLNELLRKAPTAKKINLLTRLAKIGGPEALKTISSHFDHDNENVRKQAIHAAVTMLVKSNKSLNQGLAMLDSSVNNEVKNKIKHEVMAIRANENNSKQKSDAYLPDYGSENNKKDKKSPSPTETPQTIKLFSGHDLTHWTPVGANADSWHVEDGVLYTQGGGGGWLSTNKTYDNFELQLEFKLPEGGNSGVFIRAPRKGNPAYQGIEIQLLDDYAEQYADLHDWQYTGSLYDVKAPSKEAVKQAGTWQKMTITVNGPHIKVVLNGVKINEANLINFMDRVEEHPGLKRRSGYIGLQNHHSRVEFRNIILTKIK